MDKRRHYVLVLDTETANTLRTGNTLDISNTLAYDIGYCIMDTRGNVYLEKSFVNSDIFFYEPHLMQNAYYGAKVPQYYEDLRTGKRILHNTAKIRREMLDDMEEYNIKEVCAHNARFDIATLNNTLRYVSKSKYRYWLPYGCEVWDSMSMARSVIHKMPTFKEFVDYYGLRTSSGRLPLTAEILYKFITKEPDFQESHTGLEDVQIEREIIKYCYKQKKPMKKVLYARKEV